MPDLPEIVCICGSTRFAEEMLATNRDLMFAGAIVVAPGVIIQREHMEISEEQKAALDELRLRKDRPCRSGPGGRQPRLLRR